MSKPERLSKAIADYHLGVCQELLNEREQLSQQTDYLKGELKRIDAVKHEINECLTAAYKFLHVFNVRLPEDGYAILGLFEDGTEPPL